MTQTRSIPPSLAGVLSELELTRPAVVGIAGLERIAHHLGLRSSGESIATRLRALGWLLPLRVRGMWEFAPADRAGPFPGGDAFIELRAALASHPQLQAGVGFESAAFLRGLATRQPAREVIVVAQGTARLPALSEFRRVELTLPKTAFSDVDGLPVQTITGILAAIAIRPDGFTDWPGLGEWLPAGAQQVDATQLKSFLAGRNAAGWARAIYLLRSGGNTIAGEELAAVAPARKGPFYLGPRRSGGHHDAATRVIDTVVARYASAHQGT